MDTNRKPGIPIAVVRTGTANLASVVAGLRRAGAEPTVTHDPQTLAEATHVMLPGVGAFGASMHELEIQGLDEPLRGRIRAGRPTMAICVGLQLLCESSQETEGASGLGVVSGKVERFSSASVRVPQLGWNEVVPDDSCRYLQSGYAYFANSYCLFEAPVGWRVAYAEHGNKFVAAMERGAVLACQFHPELSGQWGLTLLRRWLTMSNTDGGSQC